MNRYTLTPVIISLTSKYLFANIRGMRYTFKQFKTEYPDDKACLKAVLDNRYGDTCPRCGVVGVKFHPITGRKGFVCSECDRHIYPLADTIFRKSETSLWNWFYAIYLFSVSKNGVSAKELERHLGVTYKTAWRMAKQIRLLMQQDTDMLSGTVEIDETYMGGKRRGQKRGRGTGDKTPVFGMVERQGSVKAFVTEDLSGDSVEYLINDSISRPSIVNTDYFHLYKRMIPNLGFQHDKVNHSKGEYVKGAAHTNTIEGFWGQMKRSIDGTYHAVSPKYLQSYVNEFAFRYNLRHLPICPVLLERAARLS